MTTTISDDDNTIPEPFGFSRNIFHALKMHDTCSKRIYQCILFVSLCAFNSSFVHIHNPSLSLDISSSMGIFFFSLLQMVSKRKTICELFRLMCHRVQQQDQRNGIAVPFGICFFFFLTCLHILKLH